LQRYAGGCVFERRQILLHQPTVEHWHRDPGPQARTQSMRDIPSRLVRNCLLSNQPGTLLPSLGKYIYSRSPDGLWVNLYIGSQVRTELRNGSKVGLRQISNYPWEGGVRLIVESEGPVEFSLQLRVPGWAGKAAF